MPVSIINGIRIYSECHGEGPAVVLVHGSWGDHHNWDSVVSGFARTFRALTYDRRGHSQSERLTNQGSIEEDVADLALLVTTQHLALAHIVGNSFGASIVLKLALTRPELFASLTVHEPPLVGLLGSDPSLLTVQERIGAVVATLRSAGRSWARNSLSRPSHLDQTCGKHFHVRSNRPLCSMHRPGWTRSTRRRHYGWTLNASRDSAVRR